jgi:hypothetical protein
MKATLRVLASIIASSALAFTAIAADQPTSFEPSPKQPEKRAEWNVWVEVLMVSMPLEKGLALLPELRAPDKIEGAVTQMLKAVERKEATITGWPAGTSPDRMRFVIETIPEKRYPAGLDQAFAPKDPVAPSANISTRAASDSPIFTTFETRNIGATLEAEPTVLSGGQSISLSLVAQRVGFLGWDSYDTVRMLSGKVFATDHPRFFSLKATTATMLRNGERQLIAIHKLPPPDNEIEFFIVHALATPAK